MININMKDKQLFFDDEIYEQIFSEHFFRELAKIGRLIFNLKRKNTSFIDGQGRDGWSN